MQTAVASGRTGRGNVQSVPYETAVANNNTTQYAAAVSSGRKQQGAAAASSTACGAANNSGKNIAPATNKSQ